MFGLVNGHSEGWLHLDYARSLASTHESPSLAYPSGLSEHPAPQNTLLSSFLGTQKPPRLPMPHGYQLAPQLGPQFDSFKVP